MESYVEVNVGDNLAEVLGGVEIVTKDDEIIEIRLRQADEVDESEEAVTQIIHEVRAQNRAQG